MFPLSGLMFLLLLTLINCPDSRVLPTQHGLIMFCEIEERFTEIFDEHILNASCACQSHCHSAVHRLSLTQPKIDFDLVECLPLDFVDSHSVGQVHWELDANIFAVLDLLTYRSERDAILYLIQTLTGMHIGFVQVNYQELRYTLREQNLFNLSSGTIKNANFGSEIAINDNLSSFAQKQRFFMIPAIVIFYF